MSELIPPPSPREPSRPPEPGTPTGEQVAWSALGTLLAGPITWGFAGWLVDRATGTERVFTAVGVVIGFVTSLYIVFVRFGRD